jgi:hypothetical protein
MGNLKQMMPLASASDLAAAAASPGKPGAAAGNSAVAKQEDFAFRTDVVSFCVLKQGFAMGPTEVDLVSNQLKE